VYIFFWSKTDDPPSEPTPKNQVQKLGPEIRLIRLKIRYLPTSWDRSSDVANFQQFPDVT